VTKGSRIAPVTALCDDDDMDFSLKLATAVLARTPDALSALLSGLGEEWTAANEGRDTWSPFQVLGHLTHVEESDWMDRTTTILASANRPPSNR